MSGMIMRSIGRGDDGIRTFDRLRQAANSFADTPLFRPAHIPLLVLDLQDIVPTVSSDLRE